MELIQFTVFSFVVIDHIVMVQSDKSNPYSTHPADPEPILLPPHADPTPIHAYST